MAIDIIDVNIPVQDNSQSIESKEVTPKAVTAANDLIIKNALDNKNNSLQIYVENTYATADSTLTIKAGDKYPNAVLGDFVLTLEHPAANGRKLTVILLEDISRFEYADELTETVNGSQVKTKYNSLVKLNFSSSFTGNVWAVAKRAGIKPVV